MALKRFELWCICMYAHVCLRVDVSWQDPETVEEAATSYPIITGFPPRLHFDDLGTALVTTFQVCTHAQTREGICKEVRCIGGEVSKLIIATKYTNVHALAHTLLQVMTIANWNDNLYDAFVALDKSLFSAVYYWAIIIFGQWMLFNLFVAILIQKFLQQREKVPFHTFKHS